MFLISYKIIFKTVDREDMDLLDILKDMDEKPVEEDSVMGTPADVDGNCDIDNMDSDDAEDTRTTVFEK